MRKRRIKRVKKSLFAVFCLLVISFCISSGYSYLSQKVNIKGTASIGKESTLEQCVGNIKYESNSWSNNNKYYYKLVFTISNESVRNYNDWTVYFDVPDDAILESFSSTDAVLKNDKIIATSLYYNSNVNSNDSVQFEIQLSTSLSNYEPTNILLANCFFYNESGGMTENLEVKFNLTSSYGTYSYIYDVVVTNIGNDTIKNWTFSIDRPVNTSLIDAWNVNYIVKNDSINFSNMTYNGNLSPGSSIVFGIVVNTSSSNYVPSLVGEV